MNHSAYQYCDGVNVFSSEDSLTQWLGDSVNELVVPERQALDYHSQAIKRL
jgi:hypothetical protein